MSKLTASEAMKMDLYGMMKLKAYATEKEVKKAYRKQALKLHPDKNPDNPNAAKNFQNLQKAFELLTDPKEKCEYDRLLRAKEAAEERRREQDAKTRSFREKLERKEAELKRQKEEKSEYEKMEKLRKIAEKEDEERLMEEEKREEEKRKKKLKHREMAKNEFNVKIKWHKESSHTQESIKKLFSQYGKLNEVVMKGNKRMALIQYDNQFSALQCLQEAGKSNMKIDLMFQVDHKVNVADDDFDKFEEQFLKSIQTKKTHENAPKFEASSTETPPHAKTHKVNRDFESLTERKLRQAEERKKIIEEMMKNDE